MNAQIQKDLREFHHFLGEKLNNGGAELTPEEALDEWRQLHPEIDVSDEDVAAVQEALDDIAAGEKGMLLEDFDRDFRKRHNLPAQP